MNPVKPGLQIIVAAPDELGRSHVTLRDHTAIRFSDMVDLRASEARGAFIDRVLQDLPGLDRTDFSNALLKESAFLPTRPAPGDEAGKKRRSRKVLRREMPPLEALPPEVRTFCEAIANARCIDISAPLLGAFVAMGSAIGAARSAYDAYSDWEEPCVFWGAFVLRSGGRKTPVVNDLFGPHYDRQKRLEREYRAAKAAHAEELDTWSLERRGKNAEAKPRPREPRRSDVYTTDVTSEGMARMLEHNPRGIAVINDELSGFFGRLGGYGSGGPDKDRAFWLSLFRGVPAKIERASKDTVFVERGLGSVIGGIQPGMLGKAFDDESFASGLASRFLLVCPPVRVKEYRAGPTPEVRRSYEQLLEKLFNLDFEPVLDESGEGAQRTLRVPFAPECRDFLREFIPRWSEESLEQSEPVEAAMSKLEGYCFRFALVLKTIREALGQAAPEDPITLEDLKAGVALARWFRDEAIRCYEEIGREEDTGSPRKLEGRCEIIRRLGGAVTARDWSKRNTRKGREESDRELQELVDAGLASWRERESKPKGGRKTMECVLAENPEGVSGCSSSGIGPNPPTRDETDSDLESSEVSGCGLRGAGSGEQQHGPQDPKKGVLVSGTPPIGVDVQPETSREGTPRAEMEKSSVSGRPCTPQPATRNRQSEVCAEGQAPQAGVAHDLEAIGGEVVEAIPWHQLDEQTSVSRVCFNCKSRRFWRRRGSSTAEPGEWTCARCCEPTISEERVERRDFHGGAA